MAPRRLLAPAADIVARRPWASRRYTRAMSTATRRLLGGLAPDAFLARHWHRSPRLVRAAVPGFTGIFTRAELFALAQRDDVESRLVVRDARRWTLEHGPFPRSRWKDLPPQNWTLLVQGTNLHDQRADALLRRFAFAPYARLDDVMVSYAAPGGGVGPHLDSYDVFLLQGEGRRRWRWGRQADLRLKPGAPLKLLAHFTPTDEAVLAPGDLLYLPPQVAHDGVAVDTCTTYSIGFRAPAANEIGEAFLDFLRDGIALDGRYADPDLAATRRPAHVGRAMQEQVASMLARIRWSRAETDRFLGLWLTEPKAHVVFTPPSAPLARSAFLAQARRRGVVLDLRTQLLYDERNIYANGAAHRRPAAGAVLLARLADARNLSAANCAALPAPAARLIHEWYCDGYLHPARGRA
jgi:50S ribosomal protein L16 3-hydroxylase